MCNRHYSIPSALSTTLTLIHSNYQTLFTGFTRESQNPLQNHDGRRPSILFYETSRKNLRHYMHSMKR